MAAIELAEVACLHPEPEFVHPVFTSTFRIGNNPYTSLLVRAVFGRKGYELDLLSVMRILRTLTPVEREVIIRHYALHHGLANSFARIAVAGASNSYSIGRIWNMALCKIQAYVAANKIRPVKAGRAQSRPAATIDLDSKPVKELPLTPRTRNTLLRAGVITYGQLNGMETEEISFIKHMGSTTLREVLDFLGRP